MSVTGKGWTMHRGDCIAAMREMADKSVDHVITDPPYEAEAHTEYRTTRAVNDGRISDAAIDFVAMTDALRVDVACGCARVCSGWNLAFCQIEGVSPWRDAFVDAGMRWRRAQVWIKPDSCPQFTGDRPAQGFECIASAWCGSGKSKWNGGGRRGVYVHCVNSDGKNEHPTTKPLPLMLELVNLFTNPGETILDPFAGSGTTGVACLRLGRHFIGCEKDPKYFDLACDRLRAEEEGSTLHARRAGQLPLLGGT